MPSTEKKLTTERVPGKIVYKFSENTTILKLTDKIVIFHIVKQINYSIGKVSGPLLGHLCTQITAIFMVTTSKEGKVLMFHREKCAVTDVCLILNAHILFGRLVWKMARACWSTAIFHHIHYPPKLANFMVVFVDISAPAVKYRKHNNHFKYGLNRFLKE